MLVSMRHIIRRHIPIFKIYQHYVCDSLELHDSKAYPQKANTQQQSHRQLQLRVLNEIAMQIIGERV